MSSKIRVLEITESTTAGVRRHLFNLVTCLDRNRFSVSLLCSTLRDKGFLADLGKMKQTGTEIIVVPMQRSISPASDWAALTTIIRTVKAQRPDIVHTHSSKGGFLGRLAARRAGIPVVIHTPHVFPFEMELPRPKRMFYFMLERLAARWTDCFVCVSKHEQDFAVRSGLDRQEKFILIENGVDVAHPDTAAKKGRADIGLLSNDLVVAMVARFTPQKGHHCLVQAAEMVLSRIPSARFLLIGEGELKNEIEHLVDQRQLRSRFIFAGAREDVLSLYPLFDICVLPSLWESLPYSMLEAMAAGKAIVATRVGGMPEAIAHGQTGYLIPPKDPAALADAIVELLKDGRRRDVLGSAARDAVRIRYPLDRMVRSVEDLYTRVLDAKRSGT